MNSYDKDKPKPQFLLFPVTLLFITILLTFIQECSSYNCTLDATCANCSSVSTRCGQCVSNHGLNNTDSTMTICALCQVGSCSSCANDAYACDQCMPGLGIQVVSMGGSNIYNCVGCPSNCNACQANHSICTQCDVLPGFGLYNGSCIACFDTNCTNCTNSATFCNQCGDGYGVNTSDGACYACVGLCDRCWWNVGHCERCVIGYGPYLGICEPCRISGCVDCRTDATLCY